MNIIDGNGWDLIAFVIGILAIIGLLWFTSIVLNHIRSE